VQPWSPFSCATSTTSTTPFLQATHYRDHGGVLTVHYGEEEVARFPAVSLYGFYLYDLNLVREPYGGERTSKGLEV